MGQSFAARLFRWTPWLIVVTAWSATGMRVVQNYQLPGPFDVSHLGFCDFHNGVYFPALAWLQGDNPYSSQYAASYPVMRQVPLYSPLVFLVHAPLALLPLHWSEAVYYFIMTGLLLQLSRLIAAEIQRSGPLKESIFGRLRLPVLACVMMIAVLSRPGHATFFSGYFTFELVLATAYAFSTLQRSPRWSAFALAYTSIKPTYAIPLGIVLLSLRRYHTVVLGTIIAIVAAAIPLAWTILQQSSDRLEDRIVQVIDDMSGSQDFHRSQNWEKPAVSWTRLDLLGLIAKWTRSEPDDVDHLVVMVVMIVPMSIVLWRATDEGRDIPLCGPIVAFAITIMLVSLYKHSYDGLLLLIPVSGLLGGVSGWSQEPKIVRFSLCLLLGTPLVNYLATRSVLYHPQWSPYFSGERVVDIITSINSVALLVAMLVLAWRLSLTSQKLPQMVAGPNGEMAGDKSTEVA